MRIDSCWDSKVDPCWQITCCLGRGKVDHFIFSNFDTGYIILDENDAHQIVYFANGNWYTLTYLVIVKSSSIKTIWLIKQKQKSILLSHVSQVSYLFIFVCWLSCMTTVFSRQSASQVSYRALDGRRWLVIPSCIISTWYAIFLCSFFLCNV